jgi:hypothetical protein
MSPIYALLEKRLAKEPSMSVTFHLVKVCHLMDGLEFITTVRFQDREVAESVASEVLGLDGVKSAEVLSGIATHAEAVQGIE